MHLLVGAAIGALGGFFMADGADSVKKAALYGMVGVVVWKWVK